MSKSFAIVFMLLVSNIFVSCSGIQKDKNESVSAEQPTNTADSQESNNATKNNNVSPDKVVRCKLKNDERKIEVKKDKNIGCSVWYTKFGNSKSIASSSKKDESYCNDILGKVRDNLIKAGFNCK